MESELWNAVAQGGVGVIALMILILWLGKNNVWVWARELEASNKEREKAEVRHEAELKRRDEDIAEWKHLAIQGTALAELAGERSG